MCPTTEPFAEASRTFPDGPSTTIDPFDSTSATLASGVPVGVVTAVDEEVPGSDDASDEDDSNDSDSDDSAVDPGVLAAADEAVGEDAEEAAGAAAEVELSAVGVLEPQAAAAASTAVPEAARMVRRGSVRRSGVTGGPPSCSGWRGPGSRHVARAEKAALTLGYSPPEL